MVTPNLTVSQKKSLSYATLLAVITGAFFLKSYFSVFVIAVVMSYMFNPVYRFLHKKLGESSAAGLTLLISFLAIIIPVLLVVWLSTVQIKSFSSDASSYVSSVNFTNLGSSTLATTNKVLNSIPFVDVNITQDNVVTSVKSFSSTVGTGFIKYVTSTVSGLAGLITTAIIYIFIFLSLTKYGKSLLNVCKKLNPLGDEISEVYISRASAMIRGTVSGQFIIAVVQGLLAATTFALVGFSQYFFILFLIFSVLSIIPLGAGIIVMPLAIIMLLFGNIWPGVIVLLEHFIITTNVDNVLRPVLVPKEARLDPALMIVSVFAGIGFFGFLGIIIGPTLMILIVATVRMYLDVHKSTTTE